MEGRDAERVLQRVHGAKKRYETHAHAKNDARLLKRTKGEDCTAYRCPFSSLTGGEHWHVGHVPNMHHIAEIAETIRFYGQHGLTEGANP